MYSKDKIDSASRLIDSEITRVLSNSSLIGCGGCAACHVLFKLIKTLSLSESDAGDLLSQALFEDPQLNDRFIEMVEKIHMKERMMGVQFSIKSREAKDRFIDANLKNVIAELSFDIKQYGKELVLRKLLLSLVTVQLAQNIGVDHHAATEELYYFMRKNIDSDNLIHEFINKISKVDNDGYS
jgi:predicted metal-binding protein